VDFKTILEKLTEYLSYQQNAPLIFNSGLFLALFVLFYAVYIFTYKHKTFRIIYVLAFSLFFYYKSSGIFFGLLIVSTVWDYILGWAIYNSASHKKVQRFFFLMLSMVGNLGLLAYFKYSNLFIDSCNQIMGSEIANLDIILPVGISFYTFQTMSYSIDVYRGVLKPEKNILDFSFFVSFFPQLVAGPIVRAIDFLPQIRSKLYLSKEDLGHAIWLILVGLLKKAVISDYISSNFVDRVFENPSLYTGLENLMAVYGYTLQIYCDFSGYSDMAIGLALLMGFKLNINFDAPYQSLSITEFWKRWHISLSSWLKDYLYISLGGNRKGSFGSIFFMLVFMAIFYFLWPSHVLLIIYAVLIFSSAILLIFGSKNIKASIFTYMNLMVTMLLGGLWHGASWKFVVWGLLHGGALALERFLKPLTSKINKYWVVKIIAWFITFHFVAYCWIYFRASSFEEVNIIMTQIIYNFKGELILDLMMGYKIVFLLMTIGYLIHFIPSKMDNWMQKKFSSLPWIIKSIVLAFYIWMIIQIAGADVQPFIYFQF
jgi:alginate O-acetyltransferase complex protein AlgI